MPPPRAFFVWLVERLVALLVRTETSLAEFWSSTLLLVWAAGFFSRAPLPEGNAVHEIAVMVRPIGGQLFLGVLCLTVGLAQSIGNLAGYYRLRQLSAFVTAVLYGFLSLLGFHAVPTAIFNRTAAVAALVSGIVYLRFSLSLMGRRGGG